MIDITVPGSVDASAADHDLAAGAHVTQYERNKRMVRSKLGLKVLGLSALALGLMAFVASAAQAEAGANWMVNGSNISGSLLPEVQVKEIENNTASLLFTTAGGTKVEILCTSATLVNTAGGGGAARLGIEGKVDLGKVVFHGCLTRLNGTASPPCLPKTNGVNDLIETLQGRGLIRLHEGQPLTELVSDSAVFVNIFLGEECAIGEEVPVSGKLFLKDTQNEGAVEKVDHLVEQGPLTSLTALGQPATIDGKAIIALAGAHKGLKYSGLPG